MAAVVSVKNNHVFIEGSVRFEDVLLLREACNRLVQQAELGLVFDFSKVAHCDSSAVSLLLVLVRAAQHLGKPIHFVHLPKSLINMMRLCSVLPLIPLKE